MPQLIGTIDAIARERQRDVLYARAPPSADLLFDHKWERAAGRVALVEFLTAHKMIRWEECMDWNSGVLVAPYDGSLFIDLPVNVTNEQFQAVCAILEYPNGRPRFSDYRLYVFPLFLALRMV